MVGVLQIYRTAVATDRNTHVGFERADESTARLLSLPVGPIVEQLRYVNGMAAQATEITDNTDKVKIVGLRCLNTVLAEPRSRTSCEEEMSLLLHSVEELAGISVRIPPFRCSALQGSSATAMASTCGSSNNGGAIACAHA